MTSKPLFYSVLWDNSNGIPDDRSFHNYNDALCFYNSLAGTSVPFRKLEACYMDHDETILKDKRPNPEVDRFNFVCSCLYGEEHVPMTVEEAAYTIRVWTEEEGAELPEGFTPEYYATTWNELIAMDP